MRKVGKEVGEKQTSRQSNTSKQFLTHSSRQSLCSRTTCPYAPYTIHTQHPPSPRL